MFKKITLQLLLAAIALTAHAQTTPASQAQPFGKIDKVDLEMKACDFEKEANALVLFDKEDIYYDQNFNLIIENHRRVKIFNTKGEEEAKVRIEYDGGNHYEYVNGLQAETINLTDGKTEITKLDRKQIFTEQVDKVKSAVIFTFPNVKPGSVIEYKYVRTINSYSYIPAWFFQEDIPVRYSEITTTIPEYFTFSTKTNTQQQWSKYISTAVAGTIGSGQDVVSYSSEKVSRGMSNIHSLPDEPYMSSSANNLQSIYFSISAVKPVGSFIHTNLDSWPKLGGRIADDEDFGLQVRKKLAGEDEIITKAKALKTDDERISYIFNAVKTAMKWNGADAWYTNTGTKAAWEKKAGNSAEINLIVCHLLKQAGVKAYPMIVSTRNHGRVNPAYAFIYQFNRAVTYIPIDSARQYVLDATDKYNVYNEVPSELLDSYGLYISKESNKYDLVYVTNGVPVTQALFMKGQITPNGKVNGEAQFSSNSYSRHNYIESYKTDGEKKYIDHLRGGNNNLTVSGLKFENMEVDSLPLMQYMDFKTDLTGSDDNYIYFNPNMFTMLSNNPFLSDTRYSDIDFGYKKMYSISGMFKLPEGYKIDALPKNVTMTMPDNSITFKRIVVGQDGNLVVRYVLNYNKSIYFKEDYPEVHEFHKKMQEMLTEAIVLKKG